MHLTECGLRRSLAQISLSRRTVLSAGASVLQEVLEQQGLLSERVAAELHAVGTSWHTQHSRLSTCTSMTWFLACACTCVGGHGHCAAKLLVAPAS
jgi:hypothetical protein